MPKLQQVDREVARAMGRKVKTLRLARALSQESVAHAAGISRNQLQLIEAGISNRTSANPWNPHLSTLLALAQALDVSLAELTIDIAPQRGSEPRVEVDATEH